MRRYPAEFTIFKKLVLTFLLVLTPLYVTSMMMNETGSKTLKTEISNSMYSKVSYYMNTIDSEFQRIVTQQFELMYDEDLSKLSVAYSTMSNIQRMDSILRLSKRLVILKSSTRYVKDIAVYIQAIDRTISTASSSISFPTNELFDKELSRITAEVPIRLWNDRMFISIPYPERQYWSALNGPSFVIHAEIDAKALTDDLNRFVSHADGGSLLAGVKRDWFLTDGLLSERKNQLLDWLEEKSEDDRNHGSGTFVMDNRPFMVTYQKAPAMDAVMLTYTPEEQALGPMLKYQRWYWVLSVISVIVVFAFSSSIYGLIHRPLVRLLQSFRSAERGHFERIGPYRFKDEFSYLYLHFNQMIDRLNVLVHEVYEQKYRAQLAELRKLQSQINPHFFYNSFFILYRMAQSEDYESVMRLARHLGDYYRYIARDGKDLIGLGAEVQFTRTYAEIQNMRFGKRIRVEFADLPEALYKIPIPRLTLQPILENVYEHGLEKKAADGWIGVSFEEGDDRIAIVIEDNGDQLDDRQLDELNSRLNSPESVEESTGLINIHRRIRIYGKGRGGLTLARSERGGLKVRVSIPKEGEAHVQTAAGGR
ncbi:histidine kinase [Paenibacillus sp.]|uniref:sensor histidine kinase n=1 Tax=Paenibacillus sp. TaxID=58172 RepID=UPI0028110BA6|nr:histidine kinase [Paenibacillus sp.]